MSGKAVDRIKRDYRFATVPEHLIRDGKVSDRAFRLWCILDRYAGADGQAFPLRSTLADDLVCSRASLDRALAELVDGQWLTRERREAGGSNEYTLHVVTPKAVKAKVSGRGGLTGESTPRPPADSDDVLTPEATLDSPVTTPRLTGESHKEESLKEASTKEKEDRRDLNDGRDDVARLCAHLSERLNKHEVKHTVTKTWRDAARLMLDADDREEAKVHIAIDWCQDDEFWRTVIHSMSKLRIQYDKLRQAAQREKNSSNVHSIGNRHQSPNKDAQQARIDALGG